MRRLPIATLCGAAAASACLDNENIFLDVLVSSAKSAAASSSSSGEKALAQWAASKASLFAGLRVALLDRETATLHPLTPAFESVRGASSLEEWPLAAAATDAVSSAAAAQSVAEVAWPLLPNTNAGGRRAARIILALDESDVESADAEAIKVLAWNDAFVFTVADFGSSDSDSTEGPPPVTGTSEEIEPSQGPRPVTGTSQEFEPSQGPRPMTGTSEEIEPSQGPRPVTGTSQEFEPSQGPRPVTGTSPEFEPSQGPRPVTTTIEFEPTQGSRPDRRLFEVFAGFAAPGGTTTTATGDAGSSSRRSGRIAGSSDGLEQLLDQALSLAMCSEPPAPADDLSGKNVQIVFAIDNTASMGRFQAALLDAIPAVVEDLAGRYAKLEASVISFNDKPSDENCPAAVAPDNFCAALESRMAERTSEEIREVLEGLEFIYGDPDAREDVGAALQLSLQSSWNSEANKFVVVLTDASPHEEWDISGFCGVGPSRSAGKDGKDGEEEKEKNQGPACEPLAPYADVPSLCTKHDQLGVRIIYLTTQAISTEKRLLDCAGSVEINSLTTDGVEVRRSLLEAIFNGIRSGTTDTTELPPLPPVNPTSLPQTNPTELPPVNPTEIPQSKPTELPQSNPTELPQSNSTELPPVNPTEIPQSNPTELPQSDPTELPPVDPTEIPQSNPSELPPVNPTELPQSKPTELPQSNPTELPPVNPTEIPQSNPTELPPTGQPDPTGVPPLVTDPSEEEAKRKGVVYVSAAGVAAAAIIGIAGGVAWRRSNNVPVFGDESLFEQDLEDDIDRVAEDDRELRVRAEEMFDDEDLENSSLGDEELPRDHFSDGRNSGDGAYNF